LAEKDVVITYETLFELRRIEKTREDLQKLNPTFFDDVLVYINDKKALFDSKQGQSRLFASDEKDKMRLEIENIRKILKELYDTRERKIVNSAINKARTGLMIINTANMLPCERLLFDSVGMVLSEFRKNILYKLASGEVPELAAIPSSILIKNTDEAAEPSSSPSPSSSSSSELPPELTVPPPEDEEEGTGGLHFRQSGGFQNEPKDLKITPSSTDSGVNNKKIRFLAPIGEIVGPDLQIYGPYDAGTVTSLPDELARVLVEKRQAEELG
jgi:DNA replication initiation complex subunit (GINS family)